jgi:hypothetical protein
MQEFLKLPGVDRKMIATVVAAIMVIGGIIGLCGGVASLFGGALTGIGAVVGGSTGELSEGAMAVIEAAATQGTMTESQFQEAQATLQAGAQQLREATQDVGGLAGVSIFLICFGIFSIITGPLSIIVGAGLFTRQRWARMGTVIVAGLGALTALIGVFSGGGLGIGGILQLLLYGVVAYFFYTDPEMKTYLETKPASP